MLVRGAVALVEIAEGNAAFALETVERLFIGLIIAVVMRNRESDLLALIIARGKKALTVFHP